MDKTQCACGIGHGRWDVSLIIRRDAIPQPLLCCEGGVCAQLQELPQALRSPGLRALGLAASKD
jgi:hypothetical protein